MTLPVLSYGVEIDDAFTDTLKLIYDTAPTPNISPEGSMTLPVLVKEWPGGSWIKNGQQARIGFVRIESPEDIGWVASINRRYYTGLARSGIAGVPAQTDTRIDNHEFYYYVPSGQTAESANQQARFWEWFQVNRQVAYDHLAKGPAFEEVVRQAEAFARRPKTDGDASQAELRVAPPPKAEAHALQVWFVQPLPTILPDLAGQPMKASNWQKLSAADLAAGLFVPAEDSELRQLAIYSRTQSQQAGTVGRLPKYDPKSPTAQPGDIFVRSGPAGTIPHGGNYWGSGKVGDIDFDAVELRRTTKGDSYVVPMHWTADPGPTLNFYRLLESDIPCRYEEKETTLRNLPGDVKENIRNTAYQADCHRLGSPHGQYVFLGVVQSSNNCIDSLLEPWEAAFKKEGVTFLNRNGRRPASFRDQFLFFQTPNPMSWPSGGQLGTLGAALPRVAPPYAVRGDPSFRNGAADGNRPQVEPPSSPSRSQSWNGGISMEMKVVPPSIDKGDSGRLDRKRREILENRPDGDSLSWPNHGKEDDK